MSWKQLDLFPESLEDRYNKRLEEVEKKQEKLRKGHYAINSELRKEIDELKYKYETLVMAVCKNTINNNILL